jgi:hypothetical protein
MDKSNCYILADMNWGSGKIVKKYFKENGWEFTGKDEETSFYRNNEINHRVVVVVDYTGSKRNPKRFKNRVSITDKETAHNLVDLLMDKTNIRIVNPN